MSVGEMCLTLILPESGGGADVILPCAIGTTLTFLNSFNLCFCWTLMQMIVMCWIIVTYNLFKLNFTPYGL